MSKRMGWFWWQVDLDANECLPIEAHHYADGKCYAESDQFDECDWCPEYEWFGSRARRAPSAPTILRQAADVLAARGALRDTEAGERSMARCVAAFNAMTGLGLTERDGWYFMCCLKQARSRAGAYHADDLLDAVGYAALEAECHATTGEGGK